MRLSPSELEADLDRLEQGIRQLKVQYDMFQAGALDREPFELRSRVEALIRKHSNRPGGGYAHRFRLNALVSRFNTLSELWNKRVRSMEEGTHRSKGSAEKAGVRERLIGRCRVSLDSLDSSDLRRVHSRFVDAQRRAGKPEEKIPSFEAFTRGVANQTRRLQAETGCDSIELRLVESGSSIQLKARPGQQPGASVATGDDRSQG